LPAKWPDPHFFASVQQAVPPSSCGKTANTQIFIVLHSHREVLGRLTRAKVSALASTRDSIMALNIVGVCVHGLGGNLFSTGMDTLAAELNRITPVGCHFTVRGGNDPRLEDATITSDLLSALVKGATVIYIGHSLGADSALRFAQAAHNFRLPLICPVDPVSWDSNAQQVVPGRWEVGSNVARVIGYRTNAFPGGGRIVLAAGNTATNLTDTTLDVPDASPPSGLDIASSPDVHAAIIAGVRDLVTQMQTVT
jgi:hypothetical protein